MPAVSKAHQRFFGIAEHAPEKLHAKNRGLLGMSGQQLHDFAATPTKGLPMHAPKKMALGGLVPRGPSPQGGGGMLPGDAPIVAALKRGIAQRAMRRPGALGAARPMGAGAAAMPMPARPMMMARGGVVPGRGAGDTVPAKLTPGEFVVKKSAAKTHRVDLEKINAGKKAPTSRADRIKAFEAEHGDKEI